MGYFKQRRQVQIVAIAQQQAISWDEPDEMLERGFDRIEIREDIRVVEFEIIDDGDLGQVMDELAALIKKSRVVLVAFNNKPVAIGETRALAQVVRNSANEKAGVQSIVFKYPG